MSRPALDFDPSQEPFTHYTALQRLSSDRSGHGSAPRHLLYVARDKRTNVRVLFKLTAKPGLIYQQNLLNEIATLTTINRELPRSHYFPLISEHGHLKDGRVLLVISLFDEFPLATSIGAERVPGKLVAHLRTALEVARALDELHGLGIFHVDLNTMNVLYRLERGAPVVRIVDFESSYERARHEHGTSYNPPTTAGFSAPELGTQAPDARVDVYSLGAVLYTLIAGYQWTWSGPPDEAVAKDGELDPELAAILRKAVAPSPAARYPSVDAFRTALDAHLDRIWPGRR